MLDWSQMKEPVFEGVTPCPAGLQLETRKWLRCAVVSVLAWGAAMTVGAAPTPLKERLQLCASCHNPDGNSVIPDNPKLAGLDAAYLARQLIDLKSGKRKSPTMFAIMQMVEAGEIEALADYFSEQKPLTGVVAKVDVKSVEVGKEIFNEGITSTAVPACSGCHNDDGSGSDKYPRVTGQHAPYVLQQLKAMKSGERDNDERGVMRAVAKRMNEAQMQAVAHYIATLRESE
jgi:cytochrome c553